MRILVVDRNMGDILYELKEQEFVPRVGQSLVFEKGKESRCYRVNFVQPYYESTGSSYDINVVKIYVELLT